MVSNKIKHIGFIGVVVLFILVTSSCHKTDSGSNNVTSEKRTVIVYMAADNNLEYFAMQNINDMEQGWDSTMGNLIVYVNGGNGASPPYPVIYQIKHDTSSQIVSTIKWVYPSQNSCDPGVFNKVLSDIMAQYPSSSYGLVLWSHGSAWYPAGAQFGSTLTIDTFSIGHTTNSLFSINQGSPYALPLTKSFGLDGSSELGIPDLENSLPTKFDFILFDACYMGSLEVSYQLKDKAQYIIASPTEVLSTGFPYNKIVPFMFSNNLPEALFNIGDAYFNFYNDQSGVWQSASVSVVNTSQLNNLSIAANKIFSNKSVDTLFNIDSIQQYEVTQSGYLYDLSDVFNHINVPDSLRENFFSALNKSVIYKKSTSRILDCFDIKNYSGLNVYIPYNQNLAYYDYYKTLDWYLQSGDSFFWDRCIIQ